MHSFDICIDLASKLKYPYEVIASMNDKIKREQFVSFAWPDISLAWGISGIICFYTLMDYHFPHAGWEKVVHNYFLVAKENIEANSAEDLSLYTGLAGLAAAVHFSSCQGNRYQKMLSSLDVLLIQEVPFVYLRHLDNYLNPNLSIPPNYYNLSMGLSGILVYCISRDDNQELRSLAQDCLSCLVKILSESKKINHVDVPNWYIAPEHEPVFASRGKGGFKLDIPNGLLGVLASLSLAKIKGFHTNGLIELISKITEWIKNEQKIQEEQIYWTHLISIDQALEKRQQVASQQYHAWFCGTPGTVHALYLASKAIQDSHLAKFVESTFLSYLKHYAKNQVEDPSFCFGCAGLLAITFEIAQSTRNPEFFKYVQQLEENVKQFYHPHHEFGFQTLLQNEQKSLQWSPHPSLMNGTAGIGLTLLQVQGKQETSWICPLVLA